MAEGILFLSRDRGSAQTFIPVVQALRARDPAEPIVVVSLDASSRVIEAAGIPSVPLDERAFVADPESAIRDLLGSFHPRLVVSGSSPAHGPAPQTPEQFGVLVARTMGIRTLGILDTWLQYKERFCRSGHESKVAADLIPDILCVLDETCRRNLLALGVPFERMVITHNPWMDQVARDASSPPDASIELVRGGLNIVFVSQPLAEMADIRRWPYTQQSLFDGLVTCMPSAPTGARHRIWVWPHPAEVRDRWAIGMMQPRSDTDAFVTDQRGAAVLAHMDLVVTSHSTVVYEALHYGTPCVSLRPDGTSLAPLVTDELGLSHVFHHWDGFQAFLRNAAIDHLRDELRQRRDELLPRGIFFSDGRATERVLHVIDGIH